ncbi:MAG: 50S ribosomal protein L11 methyltransferase [Cyanobacteria bacterium P01_H01_bin.74]
MSSENLLNPNIAPSTLLTEIKIYCPPRIAWHLEELLWTLEGVSSVSTLYQPSTDSDQTRLEDLQALSVISSSPDARLNVEQLLSANPTFLEGCTILETRPLAPEDWESAWKAYWKVTRVSERIVICPAWLSYEPNNPNETVICIDPENAFGTGAHETTRLALRAIEQHACAQNTGQCRVLDVGTGSGVLAIFAAQLGFKEIVAMDIDPAALQTAQKNADANRVASKIKFTSSPLKDSRSVGFNLVVVNIIAETILGLFDDLMACLAPGGSVIFTGLIAKTVLPVKTKLTNSGFIHIVETTENSWYCLKAQLQ